MSRARVLIADDDPLLRMDLRAMLEDLGHEVVGEAENGEAAVLMARSLRPDVAILDIMMPGVDGLGAAAAIGGDRLAPVIMLTAYSEDQMVAEATQAGVLAYLVKPFRREELQPAIGIAISRFRELSAVEGELEALQEQVAVRRLVGKARALLASRLGISEREAYRRLQAQSLALDKPLKSVAEAIILADGLTL